MCCVRPLEFEKRSSSKCFSNLSVRKNYLERELKIKTQFNPSGVGQGTRLLPRLLVSSDTGGPGVRPREGLRLGFGPGPDSLRLGPGGEERPVRLPPLYLPGLRELPGPAALVPCPPCSTNSLTCQDLLLKAIYF